MSRAMLVFIASCFSLLGHVDGFRTAKRADRKALKASDVAIEADPHGTKAEQQEEDCYGNKALIELTADGKEEVTKLQERIAKLEGETAFVINGKGSDGCPSGARPLNSSECKVAAAHYLHDFSSDALSGYPVGCFAYYDCSLRECEHNEVYVIFNTDAGGGTWPNSATICALQAQSKPTCQLHDGSVWAMCGADEYKNWGIGPGGQEQALLNCAFSYNQGGNRNEQCPQAAEDLNEVSTDQTGVQECGSCTVTGYLERSNCAQGFDCCPRNGKCIQRNGKWCR